MECKVFYHGDATKSKFFRIPFLLTTQNGTLLAGADTNFGSTGDSAENIDTAVRRKTKAADFKAEDGWEEAFIPEALHFKDYTDELLHQDNSASYIDGMIVQDTLGIGVKNRILLVIDAWAWNGGLIEHMQVKANGEIEQADFREVARGDGFTVIQGKKYLLLSSENRKERRKGTEAYINANIDRTRFNYIADIYGKKDCNGHYVIYHLNGVPNVEEEEEKLSLGEVSRYSLDENYDLYQDGQPLFVMQKGKTEIKKVPMNIFYEDSILQMYNTSYLVQFYSDDEGMTWKKDKIISSMVKRKEATAFLASPGRGHQIQNGIYKGRIIFPVYYKAENKLTAEIIYSDDGGMTWKEGESILAKQSLSEGAVVELWEGNLMIFLRNAEKEGKIMSAVSQNGGVSWHTLQSALGDKEDGVNCQLSAINYSELLFSKKDGKKYPAILLSTPFHKSRKNGKLFIGLIKKGAGENIRVDWEYQYEITGQNKLYAYSCLTELQNKKIGLLYETSDTQSWADGLQAIYYQEFSIEELI